MVPKKKRRRKAKADSGLGVSLQDKDAEVIEKETSVPNGNLHKESGVGENEGQLSQAENSSLTNEKSPPEAGQDSFEENRHPGIADDFVDKTNESPREPNLSSQETECPPNKAKQILETEASNACINDSDSQKTIRELLQTVNVRSQASDEVNESEPPVCTACAEGSGISHGGSSETEIFIGTSRETRNTITSQEPHNDENFSLSKICASQKTGQSVAENGEMEVVITTKNHEIFPVGQTLTVVSHSCPADIGIQSQIFVSDRQRLPNPVLPSFGKKVPFTSKIGVQLYRPNFTGFHFSRGSSMIHRSPEFLEQQNRGRQNERVEGSTASLSVLSEAQSEYFPKGKPSDLGELLEVATRYVVTAWVKRIHPPISGPPTSLVIKFCVDCHKKCSYDENESNHLCLKHAEGSRKSLKLMFYVELEIYDETQETLKVALTGDQATKLFGCQPQEFVRNEECQKRVWDSFKQLIKGGNKQNLCLKDAPNFSLEPHLKGKKMNYRVIDIRPFSCSHR